MQIVLYHIKAVKHKFALSKISNLRIQYRKVFKSLKSKCQSSDNDVFLRTSGNP